MNARWAVRMIGIVMLVVLLMLLANLQKRLVEMQRVRKPSPATNTR